VAAVCPGFCAVRYLIGEHGWAGGWGPPSEAWVWVLLSSETAPVARTKKCSALRGSAPWWEGEGGSRWGAARECAGLVEGDWEELAELAPTSPSPAVLDLWAVVSPPGAAATLSFEHSPARRPCPTELTPEPSEAEVGSFAVPTQGSPPTLPLPRVVPASLPGEL